MGSIVGHRLDCNGVEVSQANSTHPAKIKQITSSFGCLVTQEENHIVLVVNLIATKRLIFFL